MATRPRIVLVHAYRPSMKPMSHALARLWPEAQALHLLDESLYVDTDVDGTLTPDIVDRVGGLLVHAERSRADAIVFTGSTFGRAVDAARSLCTVPVLRADEAIAEMAVGFGGRIQVLCTVKRSMTVVVKHVQQVAADRGVEVEVSAHVVSDAADALRLGSEEVHDERIAAMADRLSSCDVLMLAQMSMARAAQRIPQRDGRIVLTSPDAAVTKVRACLDAPASLREVRRVVADEC